MTRLEKFKKMKAYIRLCRMKGMHSFKTSDLIRYANGTFFGKSNSEKDRFVQREWEDFLASLNEAMRIVKKEGSVFCRDDRKKSVKTTQWQIV